MQRTWIIAPIVFVVLSAVGLPGLIQSWFEPKPAVGGASVAAVSPPVLLLPTPPPTTAPTATPSTTSPAIALVTPTAAVDVGVRVMATLAAAVATPSVTTQAPPRASVPTATALEAAPAPVKVGTDPFPKVGAREVIVVDGDSGAVLYEQAARRRVAPASTTKIVTAIVALERGSPDDQVQARFDESELVDSTLMGLRQGDRVSLEDLLYGLMLPSGNDAALAIASHIGGSRSRFVAMMNELTEREGLRDSHWANPHGLDAPGHYSSAWDMVQFARLGMRNPLFQALSSARSRTVRAGGRVYDVPNLNRVLGQVPGADGVKIGYTEDAGRTIVASATRNGKRVYIGAFHSTDLVGDCRPIFEWVFKNFVWPAPGR